MRFAAIAAQIRSRTLPDLDLFSGAIAEEALLYSLYRRTGALPDRHVLVDIIRSSMLQAAGFAVQSQSFTSWEILQKALLHHGGERIINLLAGPGYHGAGSDWASTYLSPADCFDRFNLRGQRKQAEHGSQAHNFGLSG